MSRSDVTNQSGVEPGERGRNEPDREPASALRGTLKRAFTSGVFTGLGGGLTLLSGLRALRRGQWGRGLVRLFAGGLLLAAGVRQRRSPSGSSARRADQREVVHTSPDVEHVAEAGLGGEEHASGDAARAVAESSVDVEDVRDESGAEATDDRAGDGASEGQVDFENEAAEPRDAIGEGTFDARRGVPVPEAAFEEGFLELDDEAFWGIRDEDDAVFVSHWRVVFEESDGVEYVTSSEVDEEQLLSVPDVILDHWEGVDDEATTDDGDELVFATTDDLRRADVLWVLTEQRADESFGL